MTLDLFFDHFELLADAPNGVQKLRELILQLAVQGKLVPQDHDDEPASELLERIKIEKAHLIRVKKIKREEPVLAITENEIPYEIPDCWKWCRWNDIVFQIGDIDHKMPQEVGIGIPYVSPRDFSDKNGIDFQGAKQISTNDFEQLRRKIQPELGDIIFPRYGTIGENRYVEVKINFLASYSCAVIKNLYGYIDSKYSFYYSLSKLVKLEIQRYINKTTQANVGVKSIKNFLYPLPPHEEQKRIVGKVEQLMKLCDELEERQQKRRSHLTQLNQGAIAQLLTATPDEFGDRWQRICKNFDLLYSLPENIGKLRQAILQLAVQGKLVPQDPSDEPALVLLEKIKAEKELLVQEKKIKKSETLSSINLDDLPFELPDSWQWLKLDSICHQITDGTHHTPTYTPTGIPFLSVKDVSSGKINLSNTKFISSKSHEELVKRCKPEFEDVLLTKVGTTGIAVVVNIDVEFSIFVSLALLKFSKTSISPYYLELVTNSPLVKEQSRRNTQGIGNKNLVLKCIKNFILPLPPLNEQMRIVARVNRLMALCDELEAKLKQTQSDSERMMEVAVRQVLTV